MSGRHSAAQATLLALAALTVVAGLALPASVSPSAAMSMSAEYPQVRRIRPTVTLQECERAGGVAEAMTMNRTICTGGADNGDPVAVN